MTSIALALTVLALTTARSQDAEPKGVFLGQLSWPEAEKWIAEVPIVIIPFGAGAKEHGPHLPVDTDEFIVTSLALAAGERHPAAMVVAPTIPYSYCLEAMDFPGTVTVASKTFMDFCVSVVKRFAYHGFDRILLLNGFPANDNLIELVGRQINLETEALCGSVTWTRAGPTISTRPISG